MIMAPAQSLANAQCGQHVELQRMPHELHIRHRGEDWAGITNQKERKKLQNRLNKRVSRQRKRRSDYPSDCSDAASTPSPRSDALMGSTIDSLITTFSYCTKEDVGQKRAMLQRFAEQALLSFMAGDPCADHRLRLIQLNTINGFTRNARALGFGFDWLICEVLSPFGTNEQTPSSATPSSLIPTRMQLSTRHHPWLDLFPFPKLRDNLLLANAIMPPEDEQRLYDDIMESGGSRSEWAGLVVWGEPWDPQSWEISLPFLQRWGWLISDCPEIITSTNYWRNQRGERPIANPNWIEELSD
ncbi:hypothetical protein PG999_014223 [Apiospora kogelbergensis]|uniref:BZIP domain-containing protein n=1 Tax=Apiospora kogelbergensis TaxID=1337665 RepID=A0AAW0Q6K8_9PEZI